MLFVMRRALYDKYAEQPPHCLLLLLLKLSLHRNQPVTVEIRRIAC